MGGGEINWKAQPNVTSTALSLSRIGEVLYVCALVCVGTAQVVNFTGRLPIMLCY